MCSYGQNRATDFVHQCKIICSCVLNLRYICEMESRKSFLHAINIFKVCCINGPFFSGSTVAYWLRFKGFYTQVWGSNPRLCNLLQIAGNPGFKSGESGLLNNYADYRGKTCKGSSTWCK
ncbi:unnamed protein product [Brassica napus]|uniref:(rape) hypothetical protein n=1 Tax=Brassica napus TaxID=3708 RepID=A0A816IVQ6_BRANA|nr:unnamed protein product [Brassica napus]